MITQDDFFALLKQHFPDAEMELVDTRGTMDHFRLWIASRAFAGKTLLQQHQLVYQALDEALKDGRIHAVEIKTQIPDPVSIPAVQSPSPQGA
jgi:stress-induced morphogen